MIAHRRTAYILYIKGKPYKLAEGRLHLYPSRAAALLAAGENADIRKVEIVESAP